MNEVIKSIQDRVKVNQDLSVTQNFNATGLSQISNLSRISTVGSLLKEIK
jgi:hypothetical protein